MKMKDKVTVVAGSGKGTGRAIALEAARQGADVVTSARSSGSAERVAAEIRQLGRRSIGVTVDLSHEADAKMLIDCAVVEFGRLDCLIYNAAYEHPQRFMKLTLEHWDQMISTNLRGFFIAAQTAARDMIEKKTRGAIVSIASTGGLVGFPNNADYCASKGRMIALTKAMAIDLAYYGIRANALAPGFIQSDAVEAVGTDALLEGIRNFIPARRFATKEDVARAAVFLASTEADYATGTVMTLDGGLTLGNIPSNG